MFGGLSTAADLSASRSEPVLTPIRPSWSGLYVGVHAGYAGTASNRDRNDESVIGGGQIGYNYHSNLLLLGLEADLSSAGLTQRNGSSADQTLNYLGTVRARLGLAFYPVLLYATGGLAFGEVSHRVTSTQSRTEIGQTFGIGLEYALTGNISVRGEYLAFFDLGRESLVQNTTFDPMQGNIGRLAVNYRF